MAEVSRRLQSGVYRLSALRNSQRRTVCPGRTPVSLPVTCTCSGSRLKDELAQNHGGIRPEPKRRAAQAKCAKRCTENTSKSKEGTISFEVDSCGFIGFNGTVQFHQTVLHLRLAPVCQQKLLSGRIPCWTRECNPDTLRSPQQLRTFCTLTLTLTEPGSQRPRSRSYSRTSGGTKAEAPPLHRSRTAYYDILNVSPGATQSQIKTAYYKQSFIYHPDKNRGSAEATERFSEISEAYSVLGDVSLRRKYDRGVLNQSDVQSAGRPSSKEAASRPTGFSQQQQQQHQRARQSSRAGGRTMFDFDAFYRAHYGEQLQKERDMRAQREQLRETQKQKLDKWREERMLGISVSFLLAMAGLIFLNISRS